MPDKTKLSLRPEETPPVAYTDLKTAAEVICQAATGQIPAPDLRPDGVNLTDEAGGMVAIRLTNDPLNKAMFAPRERFRDPERWLGRLYRGFALSAALEDWRPALQQLAPTPVGQSRLRRSILEAAAMMPLTRPARFQRRPFLDQVAEFQKQRVGGQ